jgi:hypothetical protein
MYFLMGFGFTAIDADLTAEILSREWLLANMGEGYEWQGGL